jgi:cytochrome b pre-mRNA-processing protein 3
VLGRFRQRESDRAAADRLHAAISARSREPVFYTQFQVPDTIDGRFDLLTLHAFLVMEALKARENGSELGAQLATVIFAGFDSALRDLGVGDFGLSRRIKAMAAAFYGRLEAYRAADSHAVLAGTIGRNLYRTGSGDAACAGTLARYAMAARKHLADSDVMSGIADFGPLPG